MDGGKNVVVQNNIFRDNLGAGIEISDEDNQNPTGYVLQNNISTRNYYGIYTIVFEKLMVIRESFFNTDFFSKFQCLF